MRKVNNVIGFDELLKRDNDFKITTQGIVEWLNDFLPETIRSYDYVINNGIIEYPTLVNEYGKYVRELSFQDKSIVDKRIKNTLVLLNQFYSKNKSDYLTNYQRIMEIKHDYLRNMEYISSKTQAFNSGNSDNIKKKDILMINMELLKDAIEGILNKQLDLIIYILEHNANMNPNIDEINRRYFSRKYYNFNQNNINIERDFNCLYYPSTTAIRNASAHFDFRIDVKSNSVIYKTGSRNNPIETKITLDELVSLRSDFSCISKQIGIAFELFAFEYLYELPRYQIDIEFEELLSGLSHVFLSKKIALKNYKSVDNILEIQIENFSDMDLRELWSFLLGHSTNYLELLEKYEDEVEAIKFRENKFEISFKKEVIEQYQDKLLVGDTDEYVNLILSTVEPTIKKNSNNFV